MRQLAANITACPDIGSLWKKDVDQLQSSNTTNGGVLLSHSDTGPYIHVICPEGSHVIGPKMITCLQGGVWDDVTEPYCSTSTHFGISQSDIILITVLAVCGALVIMGLTIVLTHLLCYKQRGKTPSMYTERLDRSSESNPSSSMQFTDDKNNFYLPPRPNTSFTSHTMTPPNYQEHEGHFSTDAPVYQTGSLDRNAVVLSYNITNQDGVFTLPRYYVQRTEHNRNHLTDRFSTSQTLDRCQSCRNPVSVITHARVPPYPVHEEHAHENPSFLNDAQEELPQRWQDSLERLRLALPST